MLTWINNNLGDGKLRSILLCNLPSTTMEWNGEEWIGKFDGKQVCGGTKSEVRKELKHEAMIFMVNWLETQGYL